MDRNKFFSKLMKTGEISDDEMIVFLLEYYFLDGKTIDDFQDDLSCEFDCSDSYSESCKESAKISIRRFLKRYNVENWNDEQLRLNR